MNTTAHARNQWVIRGDLNRNLIDAWENGIKAEFPGYHYDEARFDPETGIGLLGVDGSIRTVITKYDSVNYILRFPVNCYDCGCHHHDHRQCPACGSHKWDCRG